jgi:hypothetical protein
MEFLSHPAFWVVLAAISELIGLSQVEVQQHRPTGILQALYAHKPGKP